MSALISDPSRHPAYQLDVPQSSEQQKEAGVAFQTAQYGSKAKHKAQGSTSSTVTRQLSGRTLVSRGSLQQARQSVFDLPIHESVLDHGLLDRPVDEVFNEIRQHLDSVKSLTTEIQSTLHKAELLGKAKGSHTPHSAPRSGPPRCALPPLPGQSEAEAAITNAQLRTRIAAMTKKVRYQPDPQIPPRSPLRPTYVAGRASARQPRAIGFAINQTPALPPIPENSFEFSRTHQNGFSYPNAKPNFPVADSTLSGEEHLFNGFFDEPPGRRARLKQRVETAAHHVWHKIADQLQTSLHTPAKERSDNTEKESRWARFRTTFQEKTTRTRPWKPG